MFQHIGSVAGLGTGAAALYKLTHLTDEDLRAMNHTFDMLLSFAATSGDKLASVIAAHLR